MNRPALAALILLSPGTLLAESGYYGGAGLGFSVFERSAPPLFGLVEDKLDESTISQQLFAGLRWGSYLGLEAGYRKFGTVNGQSPVPDPTVFPPVGFARNSIDIDSWYGSVLGYLPLDPELDLFAKVGWHSWEGDTTFGNEPLVATGEEDGTDISYGLGLDYRGSGRWRVRLEAEYFDFDVADHYWGVTASVIYGVPFER